MEKKPQYPLDRRLTGLRTGIDDVEGRKILPPLRLKLQLR
jgi:hypothetical protein